MLVNYESLDDAARVWVYQSNREFSENEINEISLKIELFINNFVDRQFTNEIGLNDVSSTN